MNELYSAITSYLNGHAGRQYAVFDFDKTCINNDIQEMVYIYQAEEFCYGALEPEVFARIARISGDLLPEYTDLQEPIRTLEGEIADLYRQLYERQDINKSRVMSKSRDMNRSRDMSTPAADSFRADMLTLLELANAKCPQEFTYPWVLRLLEIFSDREIEELTKRAFAKNRALRRETITYHAPLLEPFGLMPLLMRGTTVNANTLHVMKFLRQSGVDVYIVSASSLEVIASVLPETEYAELLTSDRILALRVHKEEGPYISTIKEGKVRAIETLLAPRYENRPPMLAIGDSNGDFRMMRMLDREAVRVVVGEDPALRQLLKENEMVYYPVAETL